MQPKARFTPPILPYPIAFSLLSLFILCLFFLSSSPSFTPRTSHWDHLPLDILFRLAFFTKILGFGLLTSTLGQLPWTASLAETILFPQVCWEIEPSFNFWQFSPFFSVLNRHTHLCFKGFLAVGYRKQIVGDKKYKHYGGAWLA